MHDFERQDSRQTLEQGIAEYHAKNPGLAVCRDPSSEAAAFFRCHDAIHVVFGCGNGLEDEAVVKLSWPWDDYDEYLSSPLREIRRSFGIRVMHS